MSRQLFGAVREIIEEVVELPGVELHPSMDFDDLGIDSASMLQILSRVESRFEIKFQRSDLLQMESVADLLQIVEHRCRLRGC